MKQRIEGLSFAEAVALHEAMASLPRYVADCVVCLVQGKDLDAIHPALLREVSTFLGTQAIDEAWNLADRIDSYLAAKGLANTPSPAWRVGRAPDNFDVRPEIDPETDSRYWARERESYYSGASDAAYDG